MKNQSVEHLFTLQRSPFVLAPLLHQFFACSRPRERDLLLSYLVLPMVLYPDTQTYLTNASKASSLRTLCSVQSRVAGLTHLVKQGKPLTHSTLLVLKSGGLIEITDSLSVKSLGAVRTDDASAVQLRAASRLAAIFAGADIVSIYRMLGFKSL